MASCCFYIDVEVPEKSPKLRLYVCFRVVDITDCSSRFEN
jgi:hypothetical protein